ncbi:MAG: type II toxin-antitoxin system Phd/YefM family antitoxin [Bacteroidetes bacterium]|nr:type II toxin-antitoxin system Phd/YefM family antitoxin [Bacteroidota bacterium]MBU1116737.1 type II toxin-antitoxin system Phd/YefM family antitoxin [Bacteroidota bacterium]MBU1798136.1 type II toxin-antitoxin system Phd/YefM family antitoxin [Bacteroidota bacterium]
MLTTTMSEFRNNMKMYLNKVDESLETLLINRGKDKGVVIMSLDEFNALQTTQHELSSFANESRLDSAIKKLSDGKSFEKELIEE